MEQGCGRAGPEKEERFGLAWYLYEYKSEKGMFDLIKIKMMRPFLLLLLCMGLFGAGGCHSSRNMAKLTDSKWRLQTLDGEEVKLTDSAGEIFIQFNEGEKRVSGRAACNRFFGNYEAERGKLKFSQMGATRMACPDLPLENHFFRMLEEVNAYEMKDNGLTFFSGGRAVATFVKAEEKSGGISD